MCGCGMFSGGGCGCSLVVSMTGYSYMTVSIPDLGQIADIWQHMNLLQGVEETILLLLVADLRDRTLLIINITENDGIGRASLLACCL